SPLTEDIAESLIVVIIGYVVVISVPGVILGLIFMNSKTLQKKYAQLRGFDRNSKKQKKS
ncbi:MAG: hypothetical protein HN433_03810, partial [Euryarchaeota archaeon]|nr:hypothetical protein [Euryarchaeota archaeon]